MAADPRVHGDEHHEQRDVRQAERQNRRPDCEPAQRCELPPKRRARRAGGGVVHDGEDDRQGHGQQPAAQREEPPPPQVQRDQRGQHLAKDARHEERRRHRPDPPGPPWWRQRLGQVGQGHGCETGSAQALDRAQSREDWERRRQGAADGGDGKGPQRERHGPPPAVVVGDRPPDEEACGVSEAEGRRQGDSGIAMEVGRDRGEQGDGGVQLGQDEQRGNHEGGGRATAGGVGGRGRMSRRLGRGLGAVGDVGMLIGPVHGRHENPFPT